MELLQHNPEPRICYARSGLLDEYGFSNSETVLQSWTPARLGHQIIRGRTKVISGLF